LDAPVAAATEQRAVVAEEGAADGDAALGESRLGLLERDREHLLVGHGGRSRLRIESALRAA